MLCVVLVGCPSLPRPAGACMHVVGWFFVEFCLIVSVVVLPVSSLSLFVPAWVV